MIRLIEQADANRMFAVAHQNFHWATFWRDVKNYLKSINELDPQAARGEFETAIRELDALVTAMKRAVDPQSESAG